MTIVRIHHIRAADLCTRGARAWFQSHGLSWREFLEHGMCADKLDATGDALALKVTAIAREDDPNG